MEIQTLVRETPLREASHDGHKDGYGGVCPSQTAIDMIADKWKLLILMRLARSHVQRFKELQRSLGTVSQKVLTGALRDLERDGLVGRRVYPEVPPRVEYRLTESARSLIPILVQLDHWALETAKQRNP